MSSSRASTAVVLVLILVLSATIAAALAPEYSDSFEGEPADSGAPDAWTNTGLGIGGNNVTTARAARGSQSAFGHEQWRKSLSANTTANYSFFIMVPPGETDERYLKIAGYEFEEPDSIRFENPLSVGYDPDAGADGNGAFVIVTSDNVGLNTREVDDDVTPGTWIYVRVFDLDFGSSAEVSIEWRALDGSSGGERIGMSIDNQVSSVGYDRLEFYGIGTSGAGFLDAVRVGGAGANADPIIDESSAVDGEIVSPSTSALTIDVDDPDFSGGGSDEVVADLWVDGVYVGSDTLTANGTASVPFSVTPGASHSVTWYVEDGAVSTDSYTHTVAVPGILRVYNESAPDSLITDDVTGTFFLADANGTVITRTVSDGTFELDVSSADVPVTVQLESANYTTRTYRLDGLAENRSAFLLPTAETTATVRFILDDNSGSFTPPSSVTLYVERALNQSGTAEYRVVASDQFDATDSVVVELRDETRHRLRLTNAEGETRVPGSYTTRGTATETIVIGQLTIVVGDENGTAFDALLEPDTGANGVIRTAYRDADDLEHTVNVSIYELGNVSNSIVMNDSTTGSSTIISTYALPAGAEPDTTWVVEYQVTQEDGSSESGRVIVGGAADLAGPFNLDPDVQEMIVWVVFAAVIGLAVLIDARRLAPVVATVFATGFTAVGFLAFPAPVLLFAAVATVLLVASGGDS